MSSSIICFICARLQLSWSNSALTAEVQKFKSSQSHLGRCKSTGEAQGERNRMAPAGTGMCITFTHPLHAVTQALPSKQQIKNFKDAETLINCSLQSRATYFSHKLRTAKSRCMFTWSGSIHGRRVQNLSHRFGIIQLSTRT